MSGCSHSTYELCATVVNRVAGVIMVVAYTCTELDSSPLVDTALRSMGMLHKGPFCSRKGSSWNLIEIHEDLPIPTAGFLHRPAASLPRG